MAGVMCFTPWCTRVNSLTPRLTSPLPEVPDVEVVQLWARAVSVGEVLPGAVACGQSRGDVVALARDTVAPLPENLVRIRSSSHAPSHG